MLAYIPYMDPMDMVILDAFRVVLPNLANELGHQFFQSSQIIPARCGTHLHKALPTRLLNSWLLLTVAADLLRKTRTYVQTAETTATEHSNATRAKGDHTKHWQGQKM